MQNLAKMLGSKGPVKVTTALLASECSITEAALYRHFPSKSKMFESLIAITEDSIFVLINRALDEESDPTTRCEKIIYIFR